MQAQGLLDDGLHVREVRDVPLRDEAFAADDAVQLLGGLDEGIGTTSEELRHGPFDGHGRRVCAANDEVLQERSRGLVSRRIIATPFDTGLESVGVMGLAHLF